MNGDFERLQAMVEADEALAQRLWQPTDAMSFVALVVQVGAELGLSIAQADVWKALERGRQAWLQTWNP